jgi:L-glutamine-phosphate cytidylyltransferase
MYMIILAAGQGVRLRPLTDQKPKCLVELNSRPLLDWQLDIAHEAGIRQIAIVRGYEKEAIERPNVKYFENPRFATTNMVETLWCAESVFQDGFVVSYGDIVYEISVLRHLLSSKQEISVVVDLGWEKYWRQRFDDILEDAETLQVDEDDRITHIGQKPQEVFQIQGQFIGLLAFQGEGVRNLRTVYEQAKAEALAGRNPFGGHRPINQLFMTDLLQGIIDAGFTVYQVPIHRGWLEIDSLKDLRLAEELIKIQGNDLRISC